MAGKRIVKFSVYKDQKLIADSSFDREEILVGAFARADLRIDDETIERRQLVVRLTDDAVTVENLAGAGKLTLNGAPVDTTATLKSGDHVDFGRYRLLISIRDAAEAAKEAKMLDARPASARETRGGTPGLEVAMFWETELLRMRYYKKPKAVRLGEGKRDDFFVPEERLKARSYDLVVDSNGKFAVNFSNQGLDGNVLIKDKVYTVAEVRTANLLAAGQLLPLDEHTRCRLKLGNMSFLVAYTMLPAKVRGGLFGRMNLLQHLYTGLSVLGHLLLIVPLSLTPEDQLVAQRDPHKRKDRSFQVAKSVKDEKEEEEKKKKEEEEKKKAEEEAKEEVEGAGETKEEEVAKVEEKTPQKPGPKREDLTSGLAPTKVREYNRQVALNTGMAKVLNQQSDLIQNLTASAGSGWGTRGLGSRLVATGGGEGQFFPGAGGMDPWGGAGGGGGGGFMGTSLAALGGGGGGEEDIRGLSRAEARADGKIALQERESRVLLAEKEVQITGGLDRATIQRYIRSKMGQIRWCYKNELQKNRGLAGKITIDFVIAPTGSVMKPSIAATTMNNAAVESCIVQKVAMWKFPASKEGGAARVRYPFIFKTL